VLQSESKIREAKLLLLKPKCLQSNNEFLTGIRLRKSLLLLAIVAVGYVTFFTSCANIGVPSGGIKDTIPPVVVRTVPANGDLNIKDNEIRVTFNELIKNEGLNEKFVVSPPVSKRPVFRMKGKTLIVALNDKLKENTTYSLDFKDGIVDNNEGNRLKDLRLAFSTGSHLDSLRIVGFVKDAFTLEPVRNSTILLYTHKSDTLVYKTKPDYIAKTNKMGFFAATNLPADTFQIYALSDVDNNQKYTPGADSIAFLDNFVIPTAKYFPERDTVITGPDTLVVFGKTRFYPDPLHFLNFFERGFDLRLDKYDHPSRKYLDFVFTDSVKDTFNIEPLNFKPKANWKYTEMSPKLDSIRVWLTDSMDYNRDTLIFKVNYLQQDSLKKFYTKNDTLKFYFTNVLEKVKNKRKERRKVEKVSLSFTLNTNLKPIFDIYSDIYLTSPEPISSFDTSVVKLFVKTDSIYTRTPFKIRPDSVNKRRYIISHKWEYLSKYRLTIDSAAVRTIYNLPSNKIKTDFDIQEEEHYGKIIPNVQNVTGPTIIQVLRDSKDETVIKSITVTHSGEITFPFLEPEKYILKAIFDRNGNGKWDPGNLKAKIQPEEVFYYDKVIKVRGNFEYNFPLILPPTNTFSKKIRDEELEEQKLKNKGKKPKKSTAF
jgi:hypothetical protein